MAVYEVPPCSQGCPVHTDVRGYIDGINRGDLLLAAELIREHNHLASVCGWICPSPCTKDCRRGSVDEALAVRALKRFALEAAGPRPKAAGKTWREERVAIVGGGPAGLTAAADLALDGYPVTVFEAAAEPGGHLQLSVPRYRLPREVLAADVDWIRSLGVEIRTGRALGRDFGLDELFADGFNAVILAVGLSRSRGLPGFDHPRVRLALPFLQAANRGEELGIGERVVVIGGGDVAADVARTARRAGAASVRMVSLERRWEMPANPVEIREAEEEGVELQPGFGPKALEIGGDGGLRGLVLREVAAVFDAEGRFNPQFYEDRLSFLPADDIILAIGQAADLDFADEGLAVNGRLRLESGRLATVRPGVFAAGEVAEGPGPAIKAMAGGHRAAQEVKAYLRGEEPAPTENRTVIGPLPEEIRPKVLRLSRREAPVRAAGERVQDWREFEAGYGEEAYEEANRCLRCGFGAVVDSDRCAACLTCVRVCPYGVPIFRNGRIEISTQACQACGLCAANCPAEAISLRHPAWAEMLRPVEADELVLATPGRRPPTGARVLPSGIGLDPLWIWRALAEGIPVVVRPGPERHPGEREAQEAVIREIRDILERLGRDQELLRWEEPPAAQAEEAG